MPPIIILKIATIITTCFFDNKPMYFVSADLFPVFDKSSALIFSGLIRVESKKLIIDNMNNALNRNIINTSIQYLYKLNKFKIPIKITIVKNTPVKINPFFAFLYSDSLNYKLLIF